MRFGAGQTKHWLWKKEKLLKIQKRLNENLKKYQSEQAKQKENGSQNPTRYTRKEN